jgi:excisionase family DNA binding protein
VKAYWSISDLMHRWGVSRSTMYRLATEGRIKRSRVRGSVRFSDATVQAYERKMG